MTYYQLHTQAEREWNDSLAIRQQYPTFVFYWHEKYERIYDIPNTMRGLGRFARTVSTSSQKRFAH